MGCSVSFESASVPQRTSWLGGFRRPRGAPPRVPVWSVTASDSRSLQPRRVTVAAASLVKAWLVRGSVVRTVCPSSDLVAEVSKRRRTQRSHQGAVPGGGRGSSSRGQPRWSETASSARGSRDSAQRIRGGSLAGGRRSGPKKPPLFTGRRGRRSWSHWSRGVRIGLRGGDESVRARCRLDAGR